jgi:hypothetical protein
LNFHIFSFTLFFTSHTPLLFVLPLPLPSASLFSQTVFSPVPPPSLSDPSPPPPPPLGHIFPIGFKCVRQEHDALLDKIVDIKCEIEAMNDESKAHTNNTVHGQRDGHTPRNLVPLFRVTVAWEIKGKQVVRVYEARSPQQAWQAAVLEKIGLEPTENDGSSQNSVSEKVEKIDNIDNIEDAEEREREKEEKEKEKEREKQRDKEEMEREREIEYEEEDEEERLLRAEIRDQRRSFFRALRVEQRYFNGENHGFSTISVVQFVYYSFVCTPQSVISHPIVLCVPTRPLPSLRSLSLPPSLLLSRHSLLLLRLNSSHTHTHTHTYTYPTF